MGRMMTPAGRERNGYKRGDAQYDKILRTAREIITSKGLDHLTISDIAKHSGITRSLFYHYFDSKETVADAVLDNVIEEYLAKLKAWNKKREIGNIGKALDDVVDLMFKTVSESSLFHARLMTSGNATLYFRLLDKAADRIAEYIGSTTVADFVKRHDLEITNVHETFYMMIVGLITYIRSHPGVSPAVIKQVSAQTLHIEKLMEG
jgi:AcrR family transcriptional regulator